VKLARMAAMAIDEAMAEVPRAKWRDIPLLLCVAEPERPGRAQGLDDRLVIDIEETLRARFASQSAIVPHGRIAVAVALSQARDLIHRHKLSHVLIAATDSLLSWPTLSYYERRGRLLTMRNSDGFMPGEGAGALLVGNFTSEARLMCTGLGFGTEQAHIDAERPLRADGMAQAFKAALGDAVREMHDIDYLISDLSGEQYYFKESALALARTLRQHKEEFDLWHPGECTGESGAAAGAIVVALADAACRNGYTKGCNILAHMANDAGGRAAITFQYLGAQ